MHKPITFIPRRDRDHLRGRIAGDKITAQGGTAMDAMFRHVAVSFDQSAVINSDKLEVERVLKRGLTSELRLKRSHIIARFRRERMSLDTAVKSVTLAYRLERGKLAALTAEHLTPQVHTLPSIRMISWYRQILMVLRVMRRLGLQQEFATAIHGEVAAPLAPAMAKDRVSA